MMDFTDDLKYISEKYGTNFTETRHSLLNTENIEKDSILRRYLFTITSKSNMPFWMIPYGKDNEYTLIIHHPVYYLLSLYRSTIITILNSLKVHTTINFEYSLGNEEFKDCLNVISVHPDSEDPKTDEKAAKVYTNKEIESFTEIEKKVEEDTGIPLHDILNTINENTIIETEKDNTACLVINFGNIDGENILPTIAKYLIESCKPEDTEEIYKIITELQTPGYY